VRDDRLVEAVTPFLRAAPSSRAIRRAKRRAGRADR